jgi:hypothetical protein
MEGLIPIAIARIPGHFGGGERLVSVLGVVVSFW